MKLKGKMKIELRNAETGVLEKEVVEENMATNVLNDLFGMNPMGVFYNFADQYPKLTWNIASASGFKMVPICPNAVGGILLFSQPLDEDVNLVYPPTDNQPVAYASNDVNSGTQTKRGSISTTESKKLDNGYRFVWDFTTTQGNGTIRAAALTSSEGGVAGYGDTVEQRHSFRQLWEYNCGNHVASAEPLRMLQNLVEIDFDHERAYSIDFDGTTITLYTLRWPTFSIGLNEEFGTAIDYTVLETETFTPTTFQWPDKDWKQYHYFFDGEDGYWYGFANTENSSGNATVYWCRISKEDHSFTEGKWTLNATFLMCIGAHEYTSTPSLGATAVIRNGYLYVLRYQRTGIYKINLSNPADVTLINFGFTSGNKPVFAQGDRDAFLLKHKGLIIGYSFLLTGTDQVIQTKGQTRDFIASYGTDGISVSSQFFPYGNGELLFYVEQSYGTENFGCILATPYLATINNLSSEVTKTASQTMKITYDLTEETS